MTAEILIDGSKIDFMPATEYEEIMQNVRAICSTVKGSVPLDREFGVEPEILDMPVNIARARISAQFIEAVRKYEPRAEVQKVSFSEGANHEVIPVVRIRMKGAD